MNGPLLLAGAVLAQLAPPTQDRSDFGVQQACQTQLVTAAKLYKALSIDLQGMGPVYTDQDGAKGFLKSLQSLTDHRFRQA